jgi:hypothetical protein
MYVIVIKYVNETIHTLVRSSISQMILKIKQLHGNIFDEVLSIMS